MSCAKTGESASLPKVEPKGFKGYYQLEQLLPTGLKTAMLPIELENTQLLVALTASRICEQQLRVHNDGLSALSALAKCKANLGTTERGSQGTVSEVHGMTGTMMHMFDMFRQKDGEALAGLHADMEINLAEIMALIVLLRVRLSTSDFNQQAQAEAKADELRDALEMCRSELTTIELMLADGSNQNPAQCPWAQMQAERTEAERLRKQQLSIREDVYGEFLAFSEACIVEEQVHVRAALGRLESEEQLVANESQLEKQALLENELQCTDLEAPPELQLAEQLAERAQLISDLRSESSEYEGQAGRCTRIQQDLSEKAWLYSNQLEERALELEMEVAEFETLPTKARLEGATWQEPRRKKNRQEAEALSRALSEAAELRRSLAGASAEKSAALRSESEAGRDWRQSRKRSASIREALKQEASGLADLREACKGIEAEGQHVLREQRELWKAEKLQREEEVKDGTNSLQEAVHSEILCAKEEAEVAKKLRLELREMRAEQQWLRQRKHRSERSERGSERSERGSDGSDSLLELVELEHAVQQRVTKRDRQLQELRFSLIEPEIDDTT